MIPALFLKREEEKVIHVLIRTMHGDDGRLFTVMGGEEEITV